MITNDQKLQGTQECIVYFERLIGQLCATAAPEEFRLMASGYRAELVRMQAEVVGYLMRPLELQDREKAAV